MLLTASKENTPQLSVLLLPSSTTQCKLASDQKYSNQMRVPAQEKVRMIRAIWWPSQHDSRLGINIRSGQKCQEPNYVDPTLVWDLTVLLVGLIRVKHRTWVFFCPPFSLCVRQLMKHSKRSWGIAEEQDPRSIIATRLKANTKYFPKQEIG